jgi:hypothetical protein
MLDDITDHREPKTYRAIFLENEFLKATILPELGGRVYSLFDKTAQREVFYRNHVVKYGLVALRGVGRPTVDEGQIYGLDRLCRTPEVSLEGPGFPRAGQRRARICEWALSFCSIFRRTAKLTVGPERP